MHGQVVEVRWLAPRLVRVVLGGEGLDGYQPTEFTDQYVNALFVPAGAPYAAPFDLDEVRALAPEHRPVGRRYTIRSWDAATRRVAIDFVVHGDDGIAGRWARHAQPGDILQFVGPTGGYRPDPDAAWYLMVGDESALPAIAASLEAVRPGAPAVAVVVIDGPGHEIDLPGATVIHWVHRSTDPGNHTLLPEAVAALTFPDGHPDVFVHGEAGEIRAVRRHLFAERGVPKAGTSISPYWRRNFDDEAWREIKAAFLEEMHHDA